LQILEPFNFEVEPRSVTALPGNLSLPRYPILSSRVRPAKLLYCPYNPKAKKRPAEEKSALW